MINLEGVIKKMKQFGLTVTLDDPEAAERLAKTIRRSLDQPPERMAETVHSERKFCPRT